jgi:hypothetical protein
MSETAQYFPPAWFDEDEGHNSFIVDWYSSQLRALQEPSLWEVSQDKQQEVYRFLWLRTFHQPVAIRLLVFDDGRGQVILKVTHGMGGYDPGLLIVNESYALTEEQVSAFTGKVTSLKFWELPPQLKTIGCDGAEWILEGAKDGKYRLVERWSPRDGEVRELALALVGLVNLTVENIY